jgi:hypothetical protein
MSLKTHYKQTYGHNVYFLDEEKNIMYLRRPYDKSKNREYGEISYFIDDKEYTVPLYLHHIWNYFDEFGLLLACPRLKEETNSEYKNRLLDVFRYPAGSHSVGLMHGIARELGIKVKAVWKDRSEDFIIDRPMVILNNIFVDSERVNLNDVFISDSETIILKGDPTKELQTATVEYIAGLDLKSMTNKQDLDLHNKLYNIELYGTPLLKRYMEQIEALAPVDWGKFVWDFSHWDTNTINTNGSSFLPNLYDASYRGFAAYKG